MFTIYKGGKKIGQTTGDSFLVDGLSPDTEYTLGVSRTVEGVESDIVKVKARTDKEQVVPLPHSLKVIDKGDSYITVKWDSELPIGVGVYNLYLDNEPLMQDLQVREYTIRKLEPSTKYKFCLCGVDAEGEETPKITVYETTTAAVDEDEPTLDVELVNIIKNGSFEAFTGRYPDEFKNPREETSGEQSDDLIVTANKEWKTDGEQSITMSVSEGAKDGMQLLMQEFKVSPGYYIAALDYKMPPPVNIGEGEEVKYKHSLVLHAVSHSQSVYGGEGLLYLATDIGGINDVEVVANIYVLDSGETYDATASVDGLRLYKVNKEIHDYVNAGKMSDERFREVFPYIDSAVVKEQQTDASQDVSVYHVGGGYYELPNGEKVRGKEAAQAVLGSEEVK